MSRPPDEGTPDAGDEQVELSLNGTGAGPEPREGDAASASPRVRELILASAGSGKTFRISSRIIGLLASGEPPGSIFASTFTRKAAGEILERVLVRLARAALDPKEATELAGHALGGPAAPDGTPADPAFWQGVLRRTAAALHRLDVSTLDAFFVRAVGTFAHDLGLPAGWRVADAPTEARLRGEALEEVLDGTDRGVLIEMVRSLHQGAARRSVHEALAREVDDVVRVHGALAPDSPGWGALRKVVGHRPDDLDARCVDAAARIAAAEIPSKANGEPDTRWVKAVAEAAERVRTRSWDDFLEKGLFGKIAEAGPGEEPNYYGKPLGPDLIDALEEAGALARADVGPELASRAEAMGRLAEVYASAFRARLLDAGRLRFEDVTRLLLEGRRPVGGRDDLFYRLDGATEHLLLDEFQDTSLLQWRALVPLADTLIGRADAPADGAAVVVADPKQSIYGWRGAEPAVVEDLEERYGLPRDAMARSWRSSQVVLDAVNRVFGAVHRAPVVAEEPVDRAVAERWGEAFRPHEAAPRDTPLPGHVRMVAGPPKIGRGADQPALCVFAAERVRELVEAAPGRSVGVLARRNATVARMIWELGRLGVPASEEGGTRLVDSASVVSVLALLRLADHPGDGLARYHVAATPVGAAVGLDSWASRRAADRVARGLRRRLVDDGYGATLASLAERLRDACDAREWLRLRRLVELGHRWDAEASGAALRVDDFVRLAEEERAESPGEDPVRVMTVHRSKGLEFDAVVLPELYGPMFGAGGDASPLAYRPDGTDAVTHAFPPVRSALVPLFEDVPELMGALEQARAGQVRDALGTLYVAMTRARYALHLVVPSDGSSGPSSERSHARLLRETLAEIPDEATVAEGDPLFEEGDPYWHSSAPAPDEGPGRGPAPAPHRIPLRTDAPRTRTLERRSPSGMEGTDDEARPVDVRFLLGVDAGSAARERGTLVHGWLEAVEWIEDGLPPEAELREIAGRVAPAVDDDTVGRLLEWLDDRLDAPAVRAALSRDRYPTDAATEVEVERELPFLLREGDALVEGFVDRLVLVREEGRVVRAEVLDYKTDRIDPDDPDALETRVGYYAPQLRAYRRAVAGLYGLEEGVVTGRLLFLETGAVVDPEAADA